MPFVHLTCIKVLPISPDSKYLTGTFMMGKIEKKMKRERGLDFGKEKTAIFHGLNQLRKSPLLEKRGMHLFKTKKTIREVCLHPGGWGGED